MTSRHLFFKAMREDMRNRGWMIALSVLGSLLAIPMTWMLLTNNIQRIRFDANGIQQISVYIFAARDFWREFANFLGGFLAAGGALVAALAGFRFVFHKNQVDTWHSLPIKRDMLFWVCYVNGVIVWLLPLLACTVLTAALSGGMVLGEEGADCAYRVIKLAAGNFVLWTVIFLLVYNLTLLAMMFSGNVLNTIVGMLVMGVGPVSLYGLCLLLCEQYLDTFFSYGIGRAIGAMYASPFFSAVVLLVEREQEATYYSIGINFLIAAALAVWAWFLYRRRPSELAEQGIRSPLFSTAIRLVAAVGAGVGGWLFFHAVTDGDVLWLIFGALLAVILVHGILDVVFRMDFHAFFAHKLQMAGTAGAVLLICFAFYGDWFGYDEYLPEKGQVAEIGVRIGSLSNRTANGWAGMYPLTSVSCRDTEAAWAFLQEMTKSRGGGETVWVRVTLTNGRNYYRRYEVNRENRDAVMPIVSGEEYLECAYCLDEGVTKAREVTLQPVQGVKYFAGRKFAGEELLELAQAYNQDVREDPETVLLGEGRILTNLEVSYLGPDYYMATFNLTVYESMERTVKALKELGYEGIVTPMTPAETASVDLYMEDFGVYRTAGDIVKAARERYRVYEKESEEGQDGQEAVGVTAVESVSGQGMVADTVMERRADLTLHVTGQDEIEELLPLISYSNGVMRWGVFKRDFVKVGITDREGKDTIGYIKTGDLPEKYIRRFGELIQNASKIE